jgi:hypothetical protein
MEADLFYQRIVKIAARSPYDRYALLAEFHTELVSHYLNLVRSMTAQEAGRTGVDGRTIGQVVGHIAEWERYIILAAGEMIAGVEWPQIMELSGYQTPDGQLHHFSSEEEFNAYQAARQADQPWEMIRDLALHTALALHTMFSQPALLSPDTLEQTRKYTWRLPNGLKLTIPVGWYLWMVSIEHEVVDHAADLGWNRQR